MLAYIRNIARREEGATAVEYGLIVAAIAAIIILVVFALGGWVKGSFKKTCDNFRDAAGPAGITQELGGSTAPGCDK